MTTEEQLEFEKSVTRVVLTHVLHRLNDFFDAGPPERFKGIVPGRVGEEFFKWLARKDGN